MRCSSIATRALLFAQQLEGLLGPGSGADNDAAGGAPSGAALLEWRGGFERVAQEHLGALVQQLLTAEGLDVAAWGPVLTRLATEAAASLSPTAITARGDLDVRRYVRVRRRRSAGQCARCHRPAAGMTALARWLTAPRAAFSQVKRLPGQDSPGDSWAVRGIACRKNVAHRRMRTHVPLPRVMLLGGALECSRSSSKLSSFDMLIDQVGPRCLAGDNMRMATPVACSARAVLVGFWLR